MWAAGVYDLGLDPVGFWEYTTRQIDALLQRMLDRQEREQQLVGLLAMLYSNTHRDRTLHPRPFTLTDFAPSRHTGPGHAAATSADHCPECGMHAYRGHTEECQRGRALIEYNLSQMALFAKDFPKAGQLTNGEALTHGE